MNTALSPRTERVSRPDPVWAPLSIRLATASDQRALERLAQLDSTRPPSGQTVIGELSGHVVAAVSLSDGFTMADPFVAGQEIVDLLRLRAEQLRPRLRRTPETPQNPPVRPLAHQVRGRLSKSAPSSRCAPSPLSSS